LLFDPDAEIMKTKAILLFIIVVILLASFIIISIKYNKALSAGNQRLDDISSQTFKSSYGDIEYILAGDGPTVLVSHGVTGGIDQGIGLTEMYFGKGYRFLYISRFGYLKSSIPENPSARLQAETYKELLDFLNIDSVFLFGNSAGGTSAIHFVVDYPEFSKGLILISSVVPGNTKALPPKSFMKIVFGSDFCYWSILKLFGRNMIQMFVPKSIIKELSKSQRTELINNIMLSGLPISKRTKGVIFDTYISNPSIDEELAYNNIKLPTLIIHAVDDPAPPIEGAREISAKIPNSELVTFNTGGHLILDHEQEIKNTIHNFVFR
jgi:pimeloyl-ACP methyl ester carboxylesterase